MRQQVCLGRCSLEEDARAEEVQEKEEEEGGWGVGAEDVLEEDDDGAAQRPRPSTTSASTAYYVFTDASTDASYFFSTRARTPLQRTHRAPFLAACVVLR